MTADTLRARYLRNEITFRDYYGALVEHIGEDALRQLLPGNHTPEDWRALAAADERLNNVPLRQWDARHDHVRRLARAAIAGLAAITGPGGWSLSDSVCVLKETARRYAESKGA